MVEFSSYTPGTPCWVDLMTTDLDGAKAFYGAVFGWDAVDTHDDEGNLIYTNLELDGRTVAGLGATPPGSPMPAVWNTYIAVDDVAATAAAVPAAGGTVMMPPLEVMEAGHMAVFADPTGAAFGVWQAGAHIGARVANEPDTWSWNELMTRDVEAALPFYATVFGWEYDAMDMGPMGTYHVIQGGENGGRGGVMLLGDDMPEQVPNHWMVYFSVADVDATVKRITDLGGQVVQGPFPAPGVGRIAIVHDPAGASFSLLEPEDA